ncbi:MAG: META domain-containing protein [Comamonas sp.]
MTRMACPGMEYEAAFVAMLDEVDDFKIKGSELTFSDDGKVLAIFTAIPAVKQE